MKTKREQLIEALDVLELVPSRPGMAASEYIKITTSGSMMQMSLASEVLGVVQVPISGKFPCKQPYFLDRRVATPFLRVARDTKSHDEINWESLHSTTGKGKRQKTYQSLQIQHGRRKAEMATLAEVTGYGDVKIDKHAQQVKLTDDQRAIIKCAFNCASLDPSTPELNCVFITTKGLVLSYNTVAMMIGKTTKFKDALPLPLHLLSMLQHDKNPKIFIQKDKVVLQFEEGMIAQTVSSKALKSFPVKSIINKAESIGKIPLAFVVSAAKLFQSMDRFSSYISAVRKQEQVLKLKVKKGHKELVISAIVPNIKLVEELRLQEKAKQDVECEWPLDVILPTMQFIGAQKQDVSIHVNEEKESPYYLSTEDVTLLVARKANK